MCVVTGGRGDPQLGRELAGKAVEQFSGRAEMADVGHARADEDLVDLSALHLWRHAHTHTRDTRETHTRDIQL